MGWVANFVDKLMAAQDSVLAEVAEETKKQGYGRAARVIVDGPQGGIFELWFCEQGVRPKPPNVQIKNTVYLTEDTLLDLITPNIKIDELVNLIETHGLAKTMPKLLPRLDFRTALANGSIKVSGDHSDVDSEEWSQILDKVLLRVAFPIVVQGLLRKAKTRR
jgi:hypothetical protein